MGTSHGDSLLLKADQLICQVTCVVALPLVQREDGSGRGQEGKSTGLEERQPGQTYTNTSNKIIELNEISFPA